MVEKYLKSLLGPRASSRLLLLDSMQGMTMLLVVVGHLAVVGMTPRWYELQFHTFLYSFHMGVFVFISGYLIRVSYHGVDNLREYGVYIGKKLKKFLIPFLLIGGLGILLKMRLCGQSLDFKQYWSDLCVLLLRPRQSKVGYLWYIHLLFIFYLLSPLLFRLSRKIIWPLLLACAIMLAYFQPEWPYLNFNNFARYFIFYLSGVLAFEYRVFQRRWWKLCAVIAAIGFVIWTLLMLFWLPRWPEFIQGFLGILVIALLATVLMKSQIVAAILQLISMNCFAIYIFHMWIINFCAAAYLKMNLLKRWGPYPYMITATVLGVLIPLAGCLLTQRIRRLTNK